jgi:hypothetical protein
MTQLSRGGRLSVAVLLVVAASACGVGQSGPTADRFDASLTLLPDGSLDVREVWVVTFGTRPTTSFERAMRADRADLFFDVHASLDGRPVSGGTGSDAGTAAISAGRRLRVRWTFPSTTNATRRFELAYRASNVVERQGARGLVRWPALQSRRRFAIGASRIELVVPPNVVFYGAPGVAEAGWTVVWRPNGIEAERAQISRDERATVQADVSVDTLALVEPVWHFRDVRARQFMPAFLSGGLFFLVIGAGVVWIVHFQHPTRRVTTSEAAPAGDDLEPAMALAVARRTMSVPIELAHATLVDLVRQGRVAVQPGADRGLAIGFDSTAPSRLAHEQVVLDQIWLYRGKADVTPGEIGRGIEQERRKFGRALIDDLVAAGLVDRDRVAVASGLHLGGNVSMVFGAVSAALVGIFIDQFGAWPIAIPGSIFVVGLVLLITGERFSVLTDTGEQVSAPWRARLRWLRRHRVSEGATGPVEAFARWLPIAAGSGLGVQWIKAFGVRLPDTDRPLIALLHALAARGRRR